MLGIHLLVIAVNIYESIEYSTWTKFRIYFKERDNIRTEMTTFKLHQNKK